MSKEKLFFDYRNTIVEQNSVKETDLQNYIEAVKAMVRSSYSSIYVIDYLNQGFEYVSENPLFLCGNSPEEVKEMGYKFYVKHVPEKDFELLLRINDIGFNFFESIPIEDRLDYTISYDFHLRNEEGKLILINQKLTPIFLNKEGKIWKALCIISLSSERESGNVKIYKTNENKIFRFDFESCRWKESSKIVLSRREVEILQLSIRGFTINEIAKTIFVSPDTVKFHRKKLFDRLEVSNISEAIICATNNKLL